MFSGRRVIFKGATRASKQAFSTSKEDAKFSFKGMVDYVIKHKQAFVNMAAMYLVVSFGVHNYKVQKAWEEHQATHKKVQLENEALKGSLLDKTWIDDVEKKIRSSKPTQNVLQPELEAKINSIVESVADLKTTEQATTTVADPLSQSVESQLSSVGSLPAGVKVSSSDSGRVI